MLELLCWTLGLPQRYPCPWAIVKISVLWKENGRELLSAILLRSLLSHRYYKVCHNIACKAILGPAVVIAWVL